MAPALSGFCPRTPDACFSCALPFLLIPNPQFTPLGLWEMVLGSKWSLEDLKSLSALKEAPCPSDAQTASQTGGVQPKAPDSSSLYSVCSIVGMSFGVP